MTKKKVTRESFRVVQWCFEWIEKHSVIKDKNGNIIEDAIVDIGDIKLSEFLLKKESENKNE